MTLLLLEFPTSILLGIWRRSSCLPDPYPKQLVYIIIKVWTLYSAACSWCAEILICQSTKIHLFHTEYINNYILHWGFCRRPTPKIGSINPPIYWVLHMMYYVLRAQDILPIIDSNQLHTSLKLNYIAWNHHRISACGMCKPKPRSRVGGPAIDQNGVS